MLGKRLINTVAGAAPSACTTDTLDLEGMPSGGSSNIAVYKLDGDATDVTGNYNGTFVNPAYGVGKLGQAAVFNGSSSYVNMGDPAALRLLGSYSISFWVNFNAVSGIQRIITKDNGNDYSGGYSIYTNGSTFEVVHSNGSFNGFSVSNAFTTGIWYNFVITFDSSNNSLKAYKNSVEIASTTTSGSLTNSGDSLFFGTFGQSSPLGQYLNGSLDQVRFFNKALDSTQVDTLYNETVATTSDLLFPSPSIVAYYKLDSTAADVTGNYDGTATNVTYTNSGQFSQAADFNGINSRINLPSNPINGASSVSFSFWIKPRNITDYQYVLSFVNSVGGWNGVGVRISNSGKINIVRANNGTVTATENSTTTLSLNVWQHVVVSVQQSGTVIYIGGNLDSTFSNTPFTTNNTGSFDIGMNEYASGVTQAFTDAQIDQIRIYNQALSQANVDTLYNEVQCPCTTDTVDYPTTNLAYYKLDGNVEDSTTNGYDGALFNSPSYTGGKFGQSITGFNYNVYPTFPNIPNGITNQSNNDSTISVWFSLTQMPASFYSLFDKTSTDGSIVPALSVILRNVGVNTFDIQINRGYNGTYWGSGYFGTKTIVLGELYHLVIDYTASTKTGNVYINNEFYGAYTLGFVNNYTISDGFNIGAYVGNGASTYAQYALQGRVDQLRIFDTVLTADQVTDLYDEVYCVP